MKWEDNGVGSLDLSSFRLRSCGLVYVTGEGNLQNCF